METLSVLAEARIDDDILSGVEIESVISGKAQIDCDEASGHQTAAGPSGQPDDERAFDQEHRPQGLCAGGGTRGDQDALERRRLFGEDGSGDPGRTG